MLNCRQQYTYYKLYLSHSGIPQTEVYTHNPLEAESCEIAEVELIVSSEKDLESTNLLIFIWFRTSQELFDQ